MSIDDLVTRRWAAADEDAERVLAREQSLLRVTPWTNCSLGLGLVALLVGVVGLVVLPRGEAHQAHFVVALVVIGVAFVSVVVSVTRGARARRRLGAAYPSVSAPVVTDAVGGSRDAPLTGQVEASGRGIDPRTRA